MPITDYRGLFEGHGHGKHGAVVAVAAFGFRAQLRSWWNRLFHRDSVEGHKFEGYK